MKKLLALFAGLGMLATVALPAGASPKEVNHGHSLNNKSNHRHSTTVPITYHNGPVITGTTNVYVIWYGTWGGVTTPAILTDLLSNIGGSPYFNINTTYYNGSGVHVSNSVHYAGAVYQNAPLGASITGTDIHNTVDNQILSGALPSDPNAVYFVMTSKDIKYAGFTTQFCGWHSYDYVNGTPIKLAFVGNPDHNSACAAQTASSPNDNIGADAMASVVAHELEEAVTDPLITAWYDQSNQENADKCAWTFGTQLTSGNGSKYNVIIGNRQYLIQQNWVNQGQGFCALSH